MNINENQNSLIEKFLDKKLSSIQQEAFEKELISEDFRKQLLLRAQLIDAHKSNEKELLVNQLNSMAKGYKKKPVKKLNLNILIGIIALCLSFFVLSFFFNLNSNGQAIYADYFIELPADVNQRGAINEENAKYQTAMEAYISGDYETTLKELNDLDSDDPKVSLYKASCLMQTDQAQEAKLILSSLINVQDPTIKENVQWYLSLISVQENDFASARKSLQTILQNEQHLFFSNATKLIQELE